MPTCCAIAIGLLAFINEPSAEGAQTITIAASKDATLIDSSSGAMANGMGNSIRCGRTGESGGNTRVRAVLHFDVASSVPKQATIVNATLRLRIIQGSGDLIPVRVHRLLQSWGEGASVADGGTGVPAEINDATWWHRFYPDVAWSTPGGDFDSAVLATQDVGTLPEAVQWTSPQLAENVQQSVDDPSTNHGWILLGEETNSYTAKRLASREYPVAAYHPQLIVQYTRALHCGGDMVPPHDVVNVSDLLAVINAWGPCIQPPCAADIAPPGGDGVMNVSDLLAVVNGWGVCTSH